MYEEYNRLYRKEHQKQRREYLRKWREEHHGEWLESQRVYRQGTPEKQFQYGVTRREKYPEQLTAWQRNNVDKVKASCAAYQTRKAGGGGEFTAQEWFTLCFATGFRCLCCGQVKSLEPDHVLPVSMGGSSYLHNIQPLCRSCNASKNDRYIDYQSWEEKELACVSVLSPLKIGLHIFPCLTYRSMPR